MHLHLHTALGRAIYAADDIRNAAFSHKHAIGHLAADIERARENLTLALAEIALFEAALREEIEAALRGEWRLT